MKRQIGVLSKEILFFNRSLRPVLIPESTGSPSELQVHSRASAIHTKRTGKLDHKYKDDMPRQHGIYYDAFSVLQGSDKFMATCGISHPNSNRNISTDQGPGSCGGGEVQGECPESVAETDLHSSVPNSHPLSTMGESQCTPFK